MLTIPSYVAQRVLGRAEWERRYLSWYLNAKAQDDASRARRAYCDLWTGRQVW